jgi:hypothetical protein
MIMRSLSATTDRTAVARLFADAADYVLLEDGRASDEATTDDFSMNDRPMSALKTPCISGCLMLIA